MTAPSPAPTPAQLDPMMFRKVLGKIPTSVAVISSIVDDERVGMTVGSLTSVSLDPPLIAFFVMRSSATLTKIRSAGKFCVNVLGQNQGDVCYAFASSKNRRFDDAIWDDSATELPRLKDAVAWIECSVDSVFDAGDHLGVMGHVRHLAAAPANHDPLIFHRGALSRVHPVKRDLATHSLHWWDL